MERASRIKAAAHYTCACCGRITDELEADHIVPLYLGGADDESNLQALCIECHATKSARESRAARGCRERAAIGVDGYPILNAAHSTIDKE